MLRLFALLTNVLKSNHTSSPLRRSPSTRPSALASLRNDVTEMSAPGTPEVRETAVRLESDWSMVQRAAQGLEARGTGPRPRRPGPQRVKGKVSRVKYCLLFHVSVRARLAPVLARHAGSCQPLRVAGRACAFIMQKSLFFSMVNAGPGKRFPLLKTLRHVGALTRLDAKPPTTIAAYV